MKYVLGIIAGNGVLPNEVAKSHISKGGEVIIAKLPGIDGDYKSYNSKDFKIGEVGALFNYFKEGGAKDIVMIGAFKRPSLKSIKVDSKGAALLGRVMKAFLFGDDKLLRIIAEFLEENEFNVISALSVLSDHSVLKPGVAIGTLSINIRKDIDIGVMAAKDLGSKDLGQAVIVRNGIVIGMEDKRGTNALIKGCAGHGGVLVKVMKPNQDERLDIPTIGCNTIDNVAQAGLNGVVIEAGKVIVVDRDAVIARAKELGLFLVGV